MRQVFWVHADNLVEVLYVRQSFNASWTVDSPAHWNEVLSLIIIMNRNGYGNVGKCYEVV